MYNKNRAPVLQHLLHFLILLRMYQWHTINLMKRTNSSNNNYVFLDMFAGKINRHYSSITQVLQHTYV